MEEKLISVIVPVYNVDKYLKKCLNSIIRQTYKNLEIIVVDDGSTDSSGRICDEYKIKDERIKVIHKKNGGLSSARNAALDIAKGDYISFVDSDDWIKENLYECVVEELIKSGADIAVFANACEKENGKIWENPFMGTYKELDNIELMNNYVSGIDIKTIACNKIYKKELFDNLRFPEGRIYEDEYIMHEILGKCRKAVFINKCLYVWFIRKGSITNSKFSRKQFDIFDVKEKKIAYFRENYPGLLQYVIYGKSDESAQMMRSIIIQFSYFRNRLIYSELKDILKSEYIKSKAEFNESFAAPLTRLAYYHHCGFFIRCFYEGIIMRIKHTVKKIIKRK